MWWWIWLAGWLISVLGVWWIEPYMARQPYKMQLPPWGRYLLLGLTWPAMWLWLLLSYPLDWLRAARTRYWSRRL